MNARSFLGSAGVAMILVVTGCGGSSDESARSDPEGPVRSAPASTQTATIVAPVEQSPATTLAENAPDAASTTTAAAAVSGGLVDADFFSEMTVTTPDVGNGEHPLLSWDEVEGAAEYLLVLTQSDGQAYWAWSGTDSQIWLGGRVDQPPADASGPYLFEPMTLQVMAVDAAGVPFAASRPTLISP